jgi:hypothetical protein
MSVIWADTALKSMLQISSWAETIKSQRWRLNLYPGDVPVMSAFPPDSKILGVSLR